MTPARALTVAVALTAAVACSAQTPELRGAWLWGKSCASQADADRMLARAASMNLNALYVLSFYWGATATYQSDLVPMNSAVAEGFDPLGYLVDKGHELGLQVHVWYVNGSCRGGKVFEEHPDWQAVNLRGARADWFDLCQPAVRDWQTKLMLEPIRKYAVDGVHFDYIRFSGTSLCVCPACREACLRDTSVDISELRYPTFPTAGSYTGNPLADPTTARVLARFSDGVPAIAENQVGTGKVILFNWRANLGAPQAVQDAMRLAIQRLGAAPGATVDVLDSDNNATRYGHGAYSDAADWVQSLGFKAHRVRDAELAAAPADRVVFMPQVYLMTDEQATALLKHVRDGGGVLFLDGPVFALAKSAAARELLGFGRMGTFFSGQRSILPEPVADSFLPVSDRPIDAEQEQRKVQAWTQWRKEQVTKLVDQVSRAARELEPKRLVTAAVFSNREGSDAVLQDWATWVTGSLVDYTIPMSYVGTPEALEKLFPWWREADPELVRTIPAVGVFQVNKDLLPAERAAEIAKQIALCRRQKAHGFVMFNLESLSDETARALGQTAIQGKVPVYSAPPRLSAD